MDAFTTLSTSEQQALAICGITKASQLSKCGLASLLGDVAKARELFPEQMSSLSDERLTEIYRSVCGTDEQAEEEAKRDESCISEEGFTRISPQLVVSRRYRQRRINKEQDKEYNIEALHKKNHSVHCVSPLRIYFSAWVTILLYIDIAAWFIVPALFMVGLLPPFNPYIIIVGLLLPLILFWQISRNARCTVCNVHIFTLRKFGINRYAHNWPIFGRLLSTSLHIIFRLWFRCPACGTPQAIMRRKSRR